jgi:hypothetical protein
VNPPASLGRVPSSPDPAEAEARMRELLASGGLAQPDEVIHDLERGELHFRWNAEKLVVILELTDEPGPWAAFTPPL